VTITPPAAAAPSPAPPPVAARDPEAVFLAFMHRYGIPVGNAAVTIAGARSLCPWLAQGHTKAEAMELAMHNNPSLTPYEAWTLGEASTGAYCPGLG
jgi:hypothetical protein